MKEYVDALALSLHDDDWLDLAFNQHQNIVEFTKQFSNKPEMAATVFLKNRDYTETIKYKTKSIHENIFNFFMSPHSESVKLELMNNIKNKTKFIIDNVKSILEEYSDNTRHFFEAQINPFPENIFDTCKPINKFKITTEDDEFLLKIAENKVLVEHNEEIRNYFDQRNSSKEICRAYSNENLDKQIRNLIFERTTSIPTNSLYKENGKYKVVFTKNQSIFTNNAHRTLDGSNFTVKMILRQNES